MCIFNKKRVNSTSEVKNMDKISVVVPCYNEEEALPVYYKEMCRVMDEMKDVVFELIFVDDGSSDATLGIMKDLNEKDSRCRYLSFSRNFGKEAAIYAGLKASEGDYVALMDVDLQEPPTLLPEMYEILQEDGYDNVATKRVTRTGEPRICSRHDGRADDLLHIQIALCGRSRTDTDCFVCQLCVKAFLICLGINCHCGNSHFPAGTDNTHRNLASVGDQ